MKRLKDLNILFLEDNMETRANYSLVLKELCNNVYEAKDYDEAYYEYSLNHIDIILADINLNGKKNGIDFIKYIRNIDFNVKIVVVSAYSNTDYLIECTSLHLINYLIKPLKKNELFSSINRALKEINNVKIVSSNKLHIQDMLFWDFNLKELFYDDKIIKLTKTEKQILNTILSNPSIELTYQSILFLSNLDESMNIETLRTMVYNIRKKLPNDFIKTVYGIGYRYL